MFHQLMQQLNRADAQAFYANRVNSGKRPLRAVPMRHRKANPELSLDGTNLVQKLEAIQAQLSSVIEEQLDFFPMLHVVGGFEESAQTRSVSANDNPIHERPAPVPLGDEIVDYPEESGV